MQNVMYSDYSEFDEIHWWFTGRNKILEEILSNLLKDKKNLNILDIGCSTGVMLPQLSLYGEVDAIEPSEFAINMCKKKNIKGVNLIHGMFPDSVPGDKKYQLITLFDTLEHFDDDLSVLRSVYNLLVPGGYLISTVPAYQWLWSHHDVMNQHKRRYTKSVLESRAISAGFRTKKISYFNTLLFVPAILVRWFRELTMFLHPGESDLRVFTDRRINLILHSIFALERHILKKINLPFGLSIIYIGEK